MDAEKFILGEGNIMKKLGISLLVLALVLSFVSANAGVGARVGVTGAAQPALVIGFNNIDLLVSYGQNNGTTVATSGQTVNNGNTLAIGATYWINKNLGVNGTYSSTTPATIGATAGTAAATLSLAVEGKAEIVKGLSLIGTLPLYTSKDNGSGNQASTTLLLNNNATVSAQFDLF